MLLKSSRGARGSRPSGPFLLNRDSPQAQGLKAFWPLGHTLGQELVSRRAAAIVNGPTISGRPGGSGLAMKFDGTDDYAAPSVVAGLPPIQGPLTLACRVWVPSGVTPTRLHVLALVKDDTGSANNSIALVVSPVGGFWSVGGEQWGGTQLAWGYEPDTTNGDYPQRWHDLVLTLDGSGNTAIYSGGVLPTRSGTTGVASGFTQSGTTGVARIGSLNTAFPSPYFNGWLADALIADRAWTPADALAWSDPATRWDLYWVPSTRVFFDVAAAGGGSIPARSPNVFTLGGVC